MVVTSGCAVEADSCFLEYSLCPFPVFFFSPFVSDILLIAVVAIARFLLYSLHSRKSWSNAPQSVHAKMSFAVILVKFLCSFFTLKVHMLAPI